MKLSFKIFLGICIPSIISIVIISAILMLKSFDINIENEINRCIQEFRLMEINVEDTLSKSTSETRDVIEIYADYYRDKGIDFIYFENGEEIYRSRDYLIIKNDEILDVKDDNILTVVQNIRDNYYILISTRLSNSGIFIYVRNIDTIYDIRDNLMLLSAILIAIILIFIALIAYVISKTLTRPLDEMQKEMIKLSKGDYNINLKEGTDELGRLAKSFNQMSKELESRNSELTDMIDSKQLFIDNLSHEINTPLTSILGYAELLEKANCTEEQKLKFLLNIQNQAKRINDIHKKLLLLSYKKNADLEMKYINVENTLMKVRQFLRIRLEKHRTNLVIRNTLDEMYGDETLIIMAISNLITNAVNASEDGSMVIVNAFEQDDKQYIHVIDEGQGISKENIEKIIEPFYRVDKARSRKKGGAGLGLSICKSIVELHNGRMEIKSQLGKGSTFILEFPKVEKE